MTLREYRRRAGLTLQQVADLLGGVHFTTVHSWETNKRVPDAITVAAIEQMTGGEVRASSFQRRTARIARGPRARAARKAKEESEHATTA
jgi:transcriptional regulator with XRE-family HTH domain